MPTDVIFPILLIPHQIEDRDERDAADARGAEGEEGQVQVFFEFDDGAGAVGGEGDVCGGGNVLVGYGLWFMGYGYVWIFGFFFFVCEGVFFTDNEVFVLERI